MCVNCYILSDICVAHVWLTSLPIVQHLEPLQYCFVCLDVIVHRSQTIVFKQEVDHFYMLANAHFSPNTILQTYFLTVSMTCMCYICVVLVL